MAKKDKVEFPWFDEKFGFKSNVKFVDDKGVIFYGEVQNPNGIGADPPVVEAAEKDMLFIVDAVTPQTYTIPLNCTTLEIIEQGPFTRNIDRNKVNSLFDDEYHQHVAAESNRAIEGSEKLDGTVQMGALFNVPIADGRAWYMVTRVRGSQCLVEHRKFDGDAYYDHHFGLGGWFTKRSIAPYVSRYHGMNQLFKKK